MVPGVGHRAVRTYTGLSDREHQEGQERRKEEEGVVMNILVLCLFIAGGLLVLREYL